MNERGWYDWSHLPIVYETLCQPEQTLEDVVDSPMEYRYSPCIMMHLDGYTYVMMMNKHWTYRLEQIGDRVVAVWVDDIPNLHGTPA